MGLTKEFEFKLLTCFMTTYVIIFTLQAILSKNYEFLYYTLFFTGLIIFVQVYHKKVHLTIPIVISLSLLGLLHFAGGALYIGGTRLYDLWFLSGVFKYDNLVHSLGMFTATFFAYNVLKPHLDHRFKTDPVLLSFLLVAIAAGFGAFIEILEFGAVIFAHAAAGVGDYFNNATDLVFNVLGAIIATLYIHPYHRSEIERIQSLEKKFLRRLKN